MVSVGGEKRCQWPINKPEKFSIAAIQSSFGRHLVGDFQRKTGELVVAWRAEEGSQTDSGQKQNCKAFESLKTL